MPANSPRRRLSALQSRISQHAKENGIAVERAYTRLAHALVCAAFTRAQREGIIPLYFVKGGAAMELRLGVGARATKDLDIGVASDPETLMQTLNAVLAPGYGDYTYRVKDAQTLPKVPNAAKSRSTMLAAHWSRLTSILRQQRMTSRRTRSRPRNSWHLRSMSSMSRVFRCPNKLRKRFTRARNPRHHHVQISGTVTLRTFLPSNNRASSTTLRRAKTARTRLRSAQRTHGPFRDSRFRGSGERKFRSSRSRASRKLRAHSRHFLNG